MALERAKKSIIYAIHEIMEKANVETIDWDWKYTKEINIPKFNIDGISHKVFYIDKPNLEDMSVSITYMPSYSFVIKSKDFYAESFPRMKTLENLFCHIFKKVYNDYDFWTDDAMEMLIYYTEKYEEKYPIR